MASINWSKLATADYDSLLNYYQEIAPKFAIILAKKIYFLIDNLKKFPRIGRIIPEMENENLREIIYRNFRIIYRIKGNDIEIVRIIHSSRKLNIKK